MTLVQPPSYISLNPAPREERGPGRSMLTDLKAGIKVLYLRGRFPAECPITRTGALQRSPSSDAVRWCLQHPTALQLHVDQT